MKQYNLDEIDIRILNLLQRDARMSIKDISREVCLSALAVSNRIEKLEKEKYILGYHASVSPMALGLYTKSFINLEVEPAEKKKFYPYIKKRKIVVEHRGVEI